jgi:hypothetical protein
MGRAALPAPVQAGMAVVTHPQSRHDGLSYTSVENGTLQANANASDAKFHASLAA